MFKQIKLVIISTLLLPIMVQATLVPPPLFDLSLVPNHDNAAYWAIPNDSAADERLMPEQSQAKHFTRMQENWFAPWNENAVNKQIRNESYPRVLNSIVRSYRNEINRGQGCKENVHAKFPVIKSNYRPFDCDWLDNIVSNADYPQFDNLQYHADNRAIITHNTYVRVFPTHDTYYRRFNSGNINPFDRLQMSVIWAGTPVYILGTTKDRSWHYIYTQSYSGWVLAKDTAHVNETFVQNWQNSREFIAIMRNDVTLSDTKSDRFITKTGIGAIFPGTQNGSDITLKVPVVDQHNDAHISIANLSNKEQITALTMPVAPTRENFAYVMQDMVSRPYSWGGRCFFNDCSLELKNIYTPFGIWLARHSKTQTEGVRLEKLDDMQNLRQRFDYLRQNGKPFMTLIYIGGHIMLYTGVDEKNIPVLYQNMWLAHGKPNMSKKYIVGQSLFAPAEIKNSKTYSMLDPNVTRYFWLAYLDEPV